jgi:hypothetical protein
MPLADDHAATVLREVAGKMLNLLGVNAAAMFPDLDGLCEHLEGRYIWADDEL